MTTSTTNTMHKSTQGFARVENKPADAAPMVINRLSGWIDMGELKAESQAWIIPTRINAKA
jgi:hypothetical protein